MTMFAVDMSTGLKKELLGGKSLREALKDKIIRLYSMTIPVASGVYTAADAAETGTRCVPVTKVDTATGLGATAKVAQVITITPTVTETTANTWTVVVNGTTIIYTSDANTTVKEICDNLTILLNIAAGGDVGAIITPGTAVMNNPKNDGLFTAADDDSVITITAATAGVSFEVSSSCTGTDNALVTATTTDNAYGIRFEPYSSVTVGVLGRLSGDTWKGVATAAGVITHGRILADDDTGALSDSLVRLQGEAAEANAFFVISHTNVSVGEEISVSLAELGWE